jgi:hypothetical protein
MDQTERWTLKKVAEDTGRPAHRIIHLCETCVVCPEVDAAGRGSVRRFGRETVFRIRLALNLPDAGIQVPLIKPLMEQLDQIWNIPEVLELIRHADSSDLVGLISRMGTGTRPVLACITPPDRVALVTPRFRPRQRSGNRLRLYSDVRELSWADVAIVANLTVAAAQL